MYVLLTYLRVVVDSYSCRDNASQSADLDISSILNDAADQPPQLVDRVAPVSPRSLSLNFEDVLSRRHQCVRGSVSRSELFKPLPSPQQDDPPHWDKDERQPNCITVTDYGQSSADQDDVEPDYVTDEVDGGDATGNDEIFSDALETSSCDATDIVANDLADSVAEGLLDVGSGGPETGSSSAVSDTSPHESSSRCGSAARGTESRDVQTTLCNGQIDQLMSQQTCPHCLNGRTIPSPSRVELLTTAVLLALVFISCAVLVAAYVVLESDVDAALVRSVRSLPEVCHFYRNHYAPWRNLVLRPSNTDEARWNCKRRKARGVKSSSRRQRINIGL